MSIKTLEHKIELLPPELQKEAADFIDFLLTKKTPRKKKKPTLKWIGSLKEYRIGIILFRLGKYDAFISFLEDMVIDGIEILSSAPEDLLILHGTAEKHQLQIISFDKDFDETGLG